MKMVFTCTFPIARSVFLALEAHSPIITPNVIIIPFGSLTVNHLLYQRRRYFFCFRRYIDSLFMIPSLTENPLSAAQDNVEISTMAPECELCTRPGNATPCESAMKDDIACWSNDTLKAIRVSQSAEKYSHIVKSLNFTPL